MEELSKFLIKIDTQTGLTYENVQEAIMKLNEISVKNKDELER